MNQKDCENEEMVIDGCGVPESSPGSAALDRAEAAQTETARGSCENRWDGNGRAGKGYSPASVDFPVVEPWPERVNGAELLDAIMRELERFAVLPKWAGVTLALFCLHTFGYWLRDVTAYIGLESPEKECGKSTLLTVLSRFVHRALVSSNISPSAFYRVIEELKPMTVLIDEADTNLPGEGRFTGDIEFGLHGADGICVADCV